MYPKFDNLTTRKKYIKSYTTRIDKQHKLLTTDLPTVEIITMDIIKSVITNRRANCGTKATPDLMKI